MLTIKRVAAVLALGLGLSAGLFADITDNYFDGDVLNRQIRTYIANVSNLIPDSTTLQNVWSMTPKRAGGYFGVGYNASWTFLDRHLADQLAESVEAFGGSQDDLAQFPESIPFLPGMAFDMRGGRGYFDIGMTGMWIEDQSVENSFGSTFMGEGSKYAIRSLGFDFRYTMIRDGQSVLFKVVRVPGFLIPAVTVQGGYNFTWMSFGIAAADTEKVNVDFRNDTIFMALQVSKKLPFLLTPYFGMKMIFSKTDSVFSWETRRPVRVNGLSYLDGAKYNSGGDIGDFSTYFQFYGGFGISLIFPHSLTFGGVYNVVTEHFGINLSVRLLGGAGA